LYQGTTSVVPKTPQNDGGLYRLLKTRSGGRLGHKANEINVGFSPWGMLFNLFARNILLFRSLFSPC
jgi:hypothetical protein